MIRGAVSNGGTPRVRLRVRGPDGYERGVTAVVDTGYTAFLALPDEVVADLGLVYAMTSEAVLADGRIREVHLYDAEVEWGDVWLAVRVTAAGGSEALLGVGLLFRHGLRIDFVPGGPVEVTPLA